MSADSLAWQRTLLLADDADPDAVAKHAADRDWPTCEEGGDWPGASVLAAWRTTDDSLVRYAEHQLYGTRFVCLSAAIPEAGEALAAELATVVPTVTLADALAVLATEPAAEPVALIRAARELATLRVIRTADGGEDPGHEAIDRHAGHANPHVRRVVRLVMGE
ncbi:hypothetical protein [Phytomonospora endophytica]|uniref:Uncharacterized protein n=1 Tax=Phytomonospora endophytica TaxID=714109 RepID=A0A841FIU5_9ACTN|nr:hypothetical protein [Phytomonospora endophytica]MBB6032569.1 hypothetical protein [Phytomonospora endophytica]GIG66281.1 hypothetical protein Pen01_25760 [Phytomonospora endophytica]